MQTLDVISVNIWQILVSLLNLVVLFLLFRRFLFRPVLKVLDERKADIDSDYDKAREAREEAENSRKQYESAIGKAEEDAAKIMADAAKNAERRGNELISEAREKAGEIRKQAENDAVLEKKRAEEDIRREIAQVSEQLASKLLGREVKAQDHQNMIDSFLQEIETDENADK